MIKNNFVMYDRLKSYWKAFANQANSMRKDLKFLNRDQDIFQSSMSSQKIHKAFNTCSINKSKTEIKLNLFDTYAFGQ